MTFTELLIYALKFFIPSFFSMIFRAVGMGYTTKKRVAYAFVGYCLYVLLVPMGLISIMGYGEFTHIASVVMLVGGILSVLIFSSDGPGKTVFIHLAQANAAGALSMLISLARRLLNFSYTIQFVLLLVTCPLILIVALRYWAKPLRFLVDNLHGNLAVYLALPLVTQYIVTVTPIYPAMFFYNYPIHCTSLVLAAETMFFLYLYTLHQSLKKLQELSKQELKNKLLQSEIASYGEYLTEARQSRHDQRHHNALLLEYLEQGETDQARHYLCQLNEDLARSALETFCENHTANAVLRIYSKKAQARGIALHMSGNIPQNLPLPEIELATLLSNVLENACAACENATQNDAFIIMTARTDALRLMLEVRNSVSGKVDFDLQCLPVSTKRGGGTGTRSMRSAVEKQGGILRFSQQGNTFFTQIILPLS